MSLVLTHHDALRARFTRDGDTWTQDFAAPDELAPPVVAIGLPSGTGSGAERLERAAGEFQATLDLANGPLLRAGAIGRGDEQRVLLVAHHLVVDTVSWSVIIEDLERAYSRLRAGGEAGLPAKTSSYAEWATGLETLVGSEALNRDLAEWRSLETEAAAALPRDAADGDIEDLNVEGLAEQVTVRLSPDETRSLTERAGRAYRMRVDEILLAALAPVLAGWTGSRKVGLTVETHGRDLPVPGADVSRTVGWFTSLFPLFLEVAPSAGAEEALIHTKERFRSISGRLGRHYSLLRYLHPHGGSLPPLPEISFNYLGRLDTGSFGGEQERRFAPIIPAEVGPYRSPRARRTFVLEVNCLVSGGRLEAIFGYSRGLHEREIVQRLAQDFVARLRRLIAHCVDPSAGKYTPSDFPEARVRQDDLDRLLTTITGGQR